MLANTVRDPKRKPSVYVPDDFMPGKERKSQTPKQMFEAIQLLNTAYGGTVLEV